MTTARNFVRGPKHGGGQNYRAILKLFLIHAHIFTKTSWTDNGILNERIKRDSDLGSVTDDGLRSETDSDDDFIEETPVFDRSVLLTSVDNKFH